MPIRFRIFSFLVTPAQLWIYLMAYFCGMEIHEVYIPGDGE